MKSWQVLRDVIEPIGVKVVAGHLNTSAALVYKWCQEPSDAGTPARGSVEGTSRGSGTPNPLDRVATIYSVSRDPRIIQWVCRLGNGFFVENPQVGPIDRDQQLLSTTQRVIEEFGKLLATVSRSIENDGQISLDEAAVIRQSWERLKMLVERFVVGCERGLHARLSEPRP